MTDAEKSDEKSELLKTALGRHAEDFAEASEGVGTDIGKAVGHVAALIEAVLRPLSWARSGIDWSQEKIVQGVASKLAKHDRAQIEPPKLLIAGPIIEQARFANEEPILFEKYENLLANALLKDTKNIIHPGYAKILNNMSPIDAYLFDNICDEIISQREEIDNDFEDALAAIDLKRFYGNNNWELYIGNFCMPISNTMAALNLNQNDLKLLEISIDNLERLRLIRTEDRYTVYDDNDYYQQLEMNEIIINAIKEIESKNLTADIVEKCISVTRFAFGFRRATSKPR